MNAALVCMVILGAGADMAKATDVTAPAHLSAQEMQPMPDLNLDTWYVHAGALPNLAPTPGTGASATTDLLDETMVEALYKRAEAGQLFERQELPTFLDPQTPLRNHQQADGTWWLFAQFTADHEAVKRAVGLWLDITDTFLRVYVNGRLLGQRGGQKPLHLRSPMAPAFLIPPGTLMADKPNILAIEVRNLLFVTAIERVLFTSSDTLQGLVHEKFYVHQELNAGLTAVMVMLAAFCLGWTMRRPEERDSLYLTLGVLGWGMLFACNSVRWPPESAPITLMGAAFGAWLSCALVLFFETRYEMRRIRYAGRLLIGGLLLIALACFMFSESRQLLAIVNSIIGISIASLGYCVYLNYKAFRKGIREAMWVLLGCSVFALCVSKCMVDLVVLHLPPKSIFFIGVAAFVISTVTTLTSRFLKLHEVNASSIKGLERRQQLQEYVVEQISNTASEIEEVARHILVSATQQQKGATEQATAVEETRITMETLLASGRKITVAAQDVLENAQTTQRHNTNVGERIKEASTQSGRIAEILGVIRDVANKSELLALNAALEGSRAGEAGKGFTLVASEMQHLAERVMSAVEDVKALTSDIRAASTVNEQGTVESVRLANETTASAKQIAMIISGQQSGTEQVSQAMDDIAEVAVQTTRLGRVTLEETHALQQMAERLRGLIAELHPERAE